MTSTATMPANTPVSAWVKSGIILMVSPSNSEPVTNITPTSRINPVTTFCSRAAVVTPK